MPPFFFFLSPTCRGSHTSSQNLCWSHFGAVRMSGLSEGTQTSKVRTVRHLASWNYLQLSYSSAVERLTAPFIRRKWSHFSPACKKHNVRNRRTLFFIYTRCRMMQKLAALSWSSLRGAADGASPLSTADWSWMSVCEGVCVNERGC